MAIASGIADMVLVGGYEKETDQPTEKVTEILATASDNLYENVAGFTFPGLYAALATAYMHRYGATGETMMKVALQNHENGALNPKAQFGKRIGDFIKMKQKSAEKRGKPIPEWDDEMAFLRDPRANPVISWPMRLFDCSPGVRRRGGLVAGGRRHGPQLHRQAAPYHRQRRWHPAWPCTTVAI